MQMNTSSEVTLAKEFLGTHWKANFTKEQFTTLLRSVIKTSGYFEGSLELKDKFVSPSQSLDQLTLDLPREEIKSHSNQLPAHVV